MGALTFRNQQGDLVDLATVAASEAKNRFGAVLDGVVHGAPVAISKHDEPKAVLMGYNEFRALVALRQSTLDAMTREFDGMLAAMQTGKAKTGVAAAFAATPQQIGGAAVAAVRTKPAPAVRAPVSAKQRVTRGKRNAAAR